MANGGKDPVEVFLGWAALGFGILIVYAEVKNVPGGPTGLLRQTITTGKIPTVKKSPGKAPAKPAPSKPTNSGGADFGRGQFA